MLTTFKDDVLIKEGAFDAAELLKLVASETRWEDWKLHYTQAGVASDKQCDALSISVLAKHDARLKVIDDGLVEVFRDGIKTYQEYNPYLVITGDEGYNLLRYSPGQSIAVHFDTSRKQNRLLSASLVLNDEHDGGELLFPRQGLALRPKAGTLVMFPSNFCFPHGVSKIGFGTRFSIVTWFY